MTRTYLFDGDFMPLVRGRVPKSMVYDEYTSTRINFFNTIEAQHGSDRKFQGNLNLRLLLHLPFSQGTGLKKQNDLHLTYHTTRPTLSLFIRTLEEALAGILFSDGSIIVSVEAEKRRAKKPSVEFILTEIE